MEKEYQKINKVTPTGDLSWKLKWFSGVIVIIATLLLNLELILLGATLGFIGAFGWTVVGILWHDRAIIMNSIFVGLFLMSIVNQVIQLWK